MTELAKAHDIRNVPDAGDDHIANGGFRWLDSTEAEVWLLYLEVSRRIAERMNRQLIETSDLSAGEYDILARLSAAPERTLRMSQLAERALYSRSRLTRTVIRMETDGLVKRTPCPDDGRGVFCTLTDPGSVRLAAAAPGHVAEVRQMLFDVLDTGEIAQLGERLLKIARVLRHEEAMSGRLTPDS